MSCHCGVTLPSSGAEKLSLGCLPFCPTEGDRSDGTIQRAEEQTHTRYKLFRQVRSRSCGNKRISAAGINGPAIGHDERQNHRHLAHVGH